MINPPFLTPTEFRFAKKINFRYYESYITTIKNRVSMFKYILSITVIAASLIGAHPSIDSTLNTATVDVNQIRQSISLSLTKVIDDLERGIATLDDANVMVVRENLYAIDADAGNVAIRVLALFKSEKTDILELDLAKKFIITYLTFHIKLLQFLPHKRNVVDEPNADCVTE